MNVVLRAVWAVGLACAAAEQVSVSPSGQAQRRTQPFSAPWPASEEPITEGTAATRLRCTADSAAPEWMAELAALHRATYDDEDDKYLVGIAMSVAPRPNGEHFDRVLQSLPPGLPVLFHSRLNYSMADHPQICAELRAVPEYPQLQHPEKLNSFVHYRATRANDDLKRTTWRSKVVLDVSRTIGEAANLFHYIVYVEDDVELSPALWDVLPSLIRGRIRMDVPDLFAEDKAAGKTAFLTHYHRDPQDHKYANGDPWALLWLARQGMLAVLWDGRFVPEAVEAMRARFDEKPLDWLVRQIKFDKGWNSPTYTSHGSHAFVNHLGKHSTFAADKRNRQVGSL